MALVRGEVSQDVREIRDRLDLVYSKAKGQERIQIGHLYEVLDAEPD